MRFEVGSLRDRDEEKAQGGGTFEVGQTERV